MQAGNVTELLSSLQEGDEEAVDLLFPLLYDELHGLAKLKMVRERKDHTLSPTALVHEAYLKLVDQTQADWKNRSHFFGVASMVMRRILINYARDRRAAKRGGGVDIVTLMDGDAVQEVRSDDLLALDEALDQLSDISERASSVVTMRFFGGLNQDEIAAALGVSVPTVQRDWQTAKAWLSRRLAADPAGVRDSN